MDKKLFKFESDSKHADQTTQHKPEDVPFESHLCDWLCECLEHRGINARGLKLHELLFLKIEGEEGPKHLIDIEEETTQLREDITNFIRHLGMTHYVSAID